MLPPGEFDGAPAADLPIADITKGGRKLKRVTLENGHVYTGETELELLEAAIKGKNEADKAIRQRELENQELRQRLNSTPAPAPAPVHAAPREPFDDAKYLELLGSKPLEATKYALSYVDGAPTADPRLDFAYKAAQEMEEQKLAIKFNQRNKDYVGTDANNERVRQILRSEGLTVTLQNLEYAVNTMRLNGELPPIAPSAEYEDIQFGPRPQAPPPRRGPGVPPPPPASNSENTHVPTNADSMPLSKLRDLINRGGR
jgi:hypothetical protein